MTGILKLLYRRPLRKASSEILLGRMIEIETKDDMKSLAEFERRYAKGEIDHATYQRILTELKG